MKLVKIHLIAGARPNFMKIAPLWHALRKESWARPVIVHTGQHYDANMSDSFFEDLELPAPDFSLGVGSGSHAEQTAKVMVAYERVCLEERPDLCVVVGDVNSTVACSLVAAKMGVKLAHLEAGLRSFDRRMPEEINRIVTDALADILWTPSEDADENLLAEGVPEEKIFRVGNIMIDSLEMMRGKIEGERAWEVFGAEACGYALVTLHRPSNVDDGEKLRGLVDLVRKTAERIRVVFPVHPRTRMRISEAGLVLEGKGLTVCDPLPYRKFMSLLFNARVAITDSGGIQEETTYLGVPCLTLRENTERPVTVTQGTNRLCGVEEAFEAVCEVLEGPFRKACEVELWDGRTSGRVVRGMGKILLESAPGYQS